MSFNAYRSGLRSAVRGLWSGAINGTQFNSTMRTLINRRLTQAFEQGANECNVTPSEFTQDEFLVIGRAIQEELTHLSSFSARIRHGRDGPIAPLFSRVEIWASRFNDIRNLGKVTTCKDQKLIWKLGATEEHCTTCPRLNGKVKRASQWETSGIRPQNPPNGSIQCGGWNCLCELNPTSKPISRGRLPRFRSN